MINNKEEILYTETNDPNFSVKIFKKRETYSQCKISKYHNLLFDLIHTLTTKYKQ